MPLDVLDDENLLTIPAQQDSFLVPSEMPVVGGPIPPPVQNPVRAEIQFVELKGSPRCHWGAKHSEVTRDLRVAWEPPCGCNSFMKALIGYPLVAQRNGGWYISRYTPDAVPLNSLNDGFEAPHPYIYCTTIRETEGMEPHPTSNKDNVFGTNYHQYSACKVTAVWETLDFDVKEDTDMVAGGYVDSFGNPDESALKRYVTINPQPSTRIQTLPQNTLIFVSDGSVVKGTNGTYEVAADVEIAWRDIPRPAVPCKLLNPYIATDVGGIPYIDPITDMLGTVNQYAWANFDKGTMLLTAAIISWWVSPIGQRLHEIRYRFKWLPLRSTPNYSAGGLLQPVKGHVLILRPDCPLPIPFAAGSTAIGYDEAVIASVPQPPTSNALLAAPQDGINVYRWRDHQALFRVPALA